MKFASIGALLGALALAGCAAAPEPVENVSATSAAAATPEQQALLAKSTITGSRIQGRKSTDRMVKGVGQQDFRDSTEIKSMGNTIRPNGGGGG